MIRNPLLAAVGVLTAAVLSAQAPATTWPQFRGTPSLAGTTQATVPAQPKVQWTYDAGDAIDSSAAIVDGVVYVGSANGVLHAVSLADGKPKWTYQASEDGIGESSPTVAAGLVYVGDLAGVFHAVASGDGQGRVDLQDRQRDQVVARGRGRHGADRLVRRAPVRARREGRQAALEGADRGLRARDARGRGRRRLHRRLRRDPARHPRRRRQGGPRRCRRAPTPRPPRPSTPVTRTTAPTTTRSWPSISKAKKIAWRYKHPQRNFPFYSSAAISGDRLFVGGRDKMLHALDLKTGQGALDGDDPRAHRLVAGRRRPAASTSGRATASSTSSTRPPARRCSSSRPAARSAPRRRSRTASS